MAKKFVAVLNESADIPSSRLFNALGHMTAGLAGNYKPAEDLAFVTYRDANSNNYPNISEHPFIVLRGRNGPLRKFKEALDQQRMIYSCFLNTMIEGGSSVQQKNTAETPADKLVIYGIVTFGDATTLDPLTKKFSLWK
jgi:hypothetical protein